MANIRNFDILWAVAYLHISAPINVEFGTGEARSLTVRSPVPNFTFIGATCRPCWAKNPFLDHVLSKNNTGMAALGACRPVGKKENSTLSKYKMAEDIQTPPRIDDYVAAQLSCCTKSKQSAYPILLGK